ncbi:hypothetical protein Q2T40_16620 [Winogradskyella maritima]|uniref:TonB-like protein n=1 Tax=Winogradskyella maritima TaxID=1517766 RepID=A0ABV8AEV4_9FLAO|nr:hypothetical protein [Winogradskyella maritima]
MKRLIGLLLLVLLASCQYFDNKKVYSEDLLQEELQTIDWNAVDEYPSFSSCDGVSGQDARRNCFQNTLLNHVNTYLAEQDLLAYDDVSDTISMKLSIDKMGALSILNLKVKESTSASIPKLDSLLRQSIVELPKVYPAIKRGQQVRTEFVLPIIIQID